jgi:hypothetical protein
LNFLFSGYFNRISCSEVSAKLPASRDTFEITDFEKRKKGLNETNFDHKIMGLHIIEAIKGQKRQTVEATRYAFEGVVTQTTDNYYQITGAGKTEKTTRRYAGLAPDTNRRIIFTELFADYYFANSFASFTKGQIIERSVQAMFDLRRSFLPGRFGKRDFWDIQIDISNVLTELIAAKVACDFGRLVAAANRLDDLSKELSQSLAVSAGAAN